MGLSFKKKTKKKRSPIKHRLIVGVDLLVHSGYNGTDQRTFHDGTVLLRGSLLQDIRYTKQIFIYLNTTVFLCVLMLTSVVPAGLSRL